MTRLELLAIAESKLGKPYLWSAKGPDAFDCSGFVTWVYHQAGGPDWRMTHNAQRLLDALPRCQSPSLMDLVFYGANSKSVTHVMFYVDDKALGASGGGSRTVTLEIAARMNACVKYRNSFRYRLDIIGFAVSPFAIFQPPSVA